MLFLVLTDANENISTMHVVCHPIPMSEQKADTQLIMTVSFDLIFLIQGGGVGTMQHFYAGPTREHIVISKGIT